MLGAGTSGQVLTSGGAGAPTWSNPAAGTVTSVTGSAPISSTGGSTPVISITAATSGAAGSMSAADKTKLDAITGTNTGDNASNTTSNTYADGKVADAINNGTTTIAPSQNAVFDALALKAAANQTFFLGTTSVAINRASGAQSLTGITSIDGTASNLSGTPALPNGTTATTQAAGNNSTRLATTAYVDNGLNGKINTYGSQTANFVLAAPSGAAGVPSFRGLVATDIPNIDWSKITSGKPTTLAGYGITDASSSSHNHTLDALSNVTVTANSAGEMLKWNGTAWVNNTLAEAGIQPAGSYLTSYTETDPVVRAINGIIKSNGTTISAATAGTDYLTPSGNGSALTGLTGGQITGNISGSAANVTGTVAVINGGTGLASTTINQLLYSSAANTISGLATNNNGILVTSPGGVPSIGNTVGAALTMPSINLSGSSNQLVLQSGGNSGTLSWSPTAARTITFPDASGTVAFENAGASWGVLGNGGTIAGTNFIGTTDPQDLVFKANSIPRLTIESATGYVKIGDATSGTISANEVLVLQQTGTPHAGYYGPSRLTIKNGTGENGAIFETTDGTITLVDFIFKTAINQRNFRYEARAANARTGAPSFHIGGLLPDKPTLSIGDDYAAFGKSIMIGRYSQPTAYLQLAAGRTDTAALKLTSGSLLATTQAGAIEFDGTNFYATPSSLTRRTFAFLDSPVFTAPNIGAAIGSGLQLSGLSVSLPVKTDGSRNLVSGAINLASAEVTGTLPVGNGGTGAASLTNHGVLVGSGAGAVTALGTGTAGQVLQSGGGAADPTYSTATYPSAAGNVGGILVSNGTNFTATELTNQSFSLAGNVAMGTANSYITGPQVSLPAGTWFVTGTVTIYNSGASGNASARLNDGTTNYASSEIYARSGYSQSITLSSVITLTATTTVRIQAASNLTTCSMRATTVNNGAGANASKINAVRIGPQ
jgi:hypothetical protein